MIKKGLRRGGLRIGRVLFFNMEDMPEEIEFIMQRLEASIPVGDEHVTGADVDKCIEIAGTIAESICDSIVVNHAGVNTISFTHVMVTENACLDPRAQPVFAQMNIYELAELVLSWWAEHEYDTTSYYGEEYNCFSRVPDFVIKAQEIIEDKNKHHTSGINNTRGTK